MRSSAKTNSAHIDRWEFERKLWDGGVQSIAGVDEVGRGPLAGPVVAAAVILPREWQLNELPSALQGLNDSKQLTEAQRERFFEFLTQSPEVRFAIAGVDAQVIDQINILQATYRAMLEALAQLPIPPDHVLVDGKPVPPIPYPQTAIVKGDSKSYSIAAASVLAKVTRDREMHVWDAQWPAYGFAVHKGYPTPQHLQALQQAGPCTIHRRSFAPLKSLQMDLPL